MSDAGPPESLLPVTVLTGFLGSGKTTLLRRLLRDPRLRETAVIVNEFGEIGLDHLLVAGAEEQVVELSSGCLCCTVRWDLITTLDRLHARRAAGELAFERVVVETTGLADPAPILHTLMSDPKVAARFRLDGVVTVVDAVNGAGTLDRHPEAVKQAAVADRLVVTKGDLAEEEQVRGLSARLRSLNPAAPLETAVQGEIAPDRLFGCGLYDASGKSPEVARWLREEAYAESRQDHHGHGHDHDHGQGHGHDPNRHDDRIRAFCVTRGEPVSGLAFSLFLELLVANRGADLLRVKGIVAVAERPETPAVIHGVQHLFHPVTWLEAWPGEDRRSRLVFITRDVPQAWIEKLLDALTAPREPALPAGEARERRA